MLYVCYSGFHWMLISGLMTVYIASHSFYSLRIFFSRAILGKSPGMVNGRQEWWICACWEQDSPEVPGGSHIYFSSGAPSSCCALCLRVHFGNRKAPAWSFYPTVPFTPLALLYLPFRKRQSNQAVQPLDGPWAGISPSCHTARLEVIDEAPFRVNPYGEVQGVPPALWPVTQQTSLILPAPLPSYCFWARQVWSDLTEKSLSDLTEKSSLGPGHKESDSPRCLIRAHCHPSLHITVLISAPNLNWRVIKGTQTSL